MWKTRWRVTDSQTHETTQGQTDVKVEIVIKSSDSMFRVKFWTYLSEEFACLSTYLCKCQIRGPLLLKLFCPKKFTLDLRNAQFMKNMALTFLQDIKESI